MINALIDECKRIFTILFIIWLIVFCLNITSCATRIVPVANKVILPNIKPCPELRMTTADTWAMDILQRTQDYRWCITQTNAMIVFIKEMNK